ncbi:TonB-dependent receptor [Govanella unica]|uniref:TonB-dependent receptor n=1 Tax=Govanella unica TaxID=2975056 RepID=A0A9X3Z6T9_9PROT|nr:TonB-dependent receptor [Govania unica]MDA5193457.1 TonB-dependent receptor [Govania unica]
MLQRKTLQSNRFKNLTLLSSASSVVLATLAVSTAFAAEATGDMAGLEEITVTAQRRTQDVREVPISMTVFSAAAIEKQNIKGVEAYFSQTPNVSFTSQGSRDRKSLSLRGVSDQLSADSNIKAGSFAFYIDEFNVASGTSNPEIVDIDRIEILRGPQGTYFGRNSIGGAINITTKQPTNEVFAQGSVGYSSFNTWDLQAIGNLPVIEDKLAVRVVGRYEHSDGNIKNINPIGGGNDSTYKYGKAIVRITPNEQLTVDLTVSGTDEKVGMRAGVPSGVLATFSKGLYAGGYGFPVINGGQALPDGVGFWPENTNRVNFNRPQDVGTKLYYATGRINYHADNFNVTSVTGYIHSKEFLHGDIDGSSLDLFYEEESIKRSSLSEELRISSNPGGRIDWTIGGIVGHDKGKTAQITYAGTQNPAPFIWAPGDAVTTTYSDGNAKNYAVFGEGSWHVNERLILTLAGRFTREKVSANNFNTSNGIITDAVNAGASFSSFSPRVAVNFAASDEVNLYATAARGFKSGGVQVGAATGHESFAPETVWNYEAGIKTEFLDKRLRMNLAAFYMDWKNMQVEYSFGVQGPGGGVSFVQGIGNAASARSYGVELDMQALVMPHLTVGGTAGYLNAKFKDFPNAVVDGNVMDLSGYTIPNAPKWTLSANVEYNREIADGYNGFIRAEWSYKDAIKSNIAALGHSGFPYDVPSFNFFNLRGGVESDNYGINVYAENIFNKKYFTNAYEKAFIGGMFLEPSFRSFGVKLTVKTN